MTVDDPSSYGEVFAGVYDAWYDTISDVPATVATIAEMARGGAILELGVGTGRLAIPLVRAGADITGLDASRSMLRVLRTKDAGATLPCVRADMARLPLHGSYAVVFVAFNTFFNLTTAEAQDRCVADVSALLSDDGCFMVEAFIPNEEPTAPESGEARRDDGAGGIVVTTTVRDPADQTVRGTHRHLPATGAPADYPWMIRYLHPAQLDALCTRHGLALADRWATFDREPFDPQGERHVSVYRRR